MAIMFITHNLGVIAQMAERVVVMYLGKVVEDADIDTLFYNAMHPYTQALLQSIPRRGSAKNKNNRLASIRGVVPDPYSAEGLPIPSALFQAYLRRMRCARSAECRSGTRAYGALCAV